jgi:multiple sugar transport system permease protein
MIRKLKTVAIYFGVAVVLIFTLAPIIWLIISSISPLNDLLSVPPRWIPSQPTFANYWDIFTASPKTGGVNYQFKRGIMNSLVVASGVTLVCLFVGSLAAYAFARLNVPFKNKFVFVLLFTQMLPGIAICIPLFMIANAWQMIDKRITLVILYCSFSLPFVVWVMKGYFQTIPEDLEDAARIDGCSRLGALFRIILPLSAPGLFATGVFAFLGAWNEFLIALIFTNTLAAKTMPVAIAEFIGRFSIDYGLMCTVGVIACIPPILLALLFQRYVVEGLVGGAVKG